MELKEIAAVAGKSGLFRVLKPTRSGMIVETLDAKQKKSVMNSTHRVSILQEISIYTNDASESVELGEVLRNIKEKHDGKVVEFKKDDDSLADFLAGVLPNYDKDRVYTSDIKKLVTWYNILIEFAPESFEQTEEVEETEESTNE